tara:strand:- start:209 stop:1093 length:885 start_codon:yes stop_codon:yes gene_type:complete
MFPFIFLIATQLFFINLFNNNEINIFKYSGLKNSSILIIISSTAFILGLLIIIIFYNFSSNLKNFYLEMKSGYTDDGKYLAVINKNGLWIKDKKNENITIINASKIEKNFILNAFISEFDENYEIIRNIKSPKIDIKNNNWIIYEAEIFKDNQKENLNLINIDTNFNSEIIQNLFSNLSSLSLIELYELRNNYKKLNYSLTDVNLHMLKLVSYPIYFILMTIFSAIIMLNTLKFKNSILKVSIGLFFSVIIYYLNNFFNVLGNTEKINLIGSVFIPLAILSLINITMLKKYNAK